ncbi:chemokine-like factor [Salarias fasciatus]|uniref:chemokine-like factor n=1 Tax=Salarias fasciatus TaxID=181472 RepID=UPI00117699D6|nr:chemokine-like factor [Salarias fasciatus]
MSGNQDERPAVEMDTSFLRSRRGIVKLAEMGTLFVAFVCFAVACLPQHIAATVLEFFITLFLLLLYLLRLNKRLTLFFWPLVDLFNSTFAAVYLIVLGLIALTTYTVTGVLVGGVACLISAALHGVESYTLFKNITFNKSRNEAGLN